MSRSYFWNRGVASTIVQDEFQIIDMRDCHINETLIRVHFTFQLENTVAYSFNNFPFSEWIVGVGITDGTFAAWNAAFPRDPAESSYGWLFQERPFWEYVEHRSPTTFVQNLAPKGDNRRDAQGERKIKQEGDALYIVAANVGTNNSPLCYLEVGWQALFLSP